MSASDLSTGGVSWPIAATMLVLAEDKDDTSHNAGSSSHVAHGMLVAYGLCIECYRHARMSWHVVAVHVRAKRFQCGPLLLSIQSAAC